MGVLLDSLAELIRRGADHLVAYVIGFASCLLIWLLWLRPAARRRRQLELALHKSHTEGARRDARLESLEAEVPQLRSELLRWQERAETERDEANWYSSQVMVLQRDLASLQQQFEQQEAQSGQLQSALQAARNEAAQAQRELETARAEHYETVEELNEQLEKLHEELGSYQDASEEFRTENRKLQSLIDQLTAEVEDRLLQHDRQRAELVRAKQQRDEAQTLLERITRVDGNAWKSPPEGDIPPRRPLRQGAAPIIAVVNLKGGVGKTTLTANLASTWFGQGKRVLAVDLDYQNSLTHLCLPHNKAIDLRRRQQCIEHLLADPVATPQRLLQFAEQINGTSGWIVGASESLSDVEGDILTRWLLGQTPDDVRFRLRKLLHDREVQDNFDCILLDCPPRLSAACINALAAADYVLIPVLLDALSSDAVPRLLSWLRMLKNDAQLCPDLRVLGLVANKVRYYGGNLVSTQQPIWDRLPGNCVQPWGEAVHRFSTTIPLRSQFNEAANDHAFAADHGEINARFRDLVHEISQRIPLYEGGRTPVLSQ